MLQQELCKGPRSSRKLQWRPLTNTTSRQRWLRPNMNGLIRSRIYQDDQFTRVPRTALHSIAPTFTRQRFENRCAVRVRYNSPP
jgi:hypothetical protein